MMVGRIAQYADPGTKYYFAVIQSDEINAFMDSRKPAVFLTTGLMNAMDDNELAFVVAHEVSHNVLGHYGKRLAASHATTAAMMVANAVVPGLGYLNHIINPAVTNAFSREFELDADKKAAEIVLNSMNISVEDSMAALLRIKALSNNPSTFILFATHPPADDRVKNLATSFSVKTDIDKIFEEKIAKSPRQSNQIYSQDSNVPDKKYSSIAANYNKRVSVPNKIPNHIFYSEPYKGQITVTIDAFFYAKPEINARILHRALEKESVELTGYYTFGMSQVWIPSKKRSGWIRNLDIEVVPSSECSFTDDNKINDSVVYSEFLNGETIVAKNAKLYTKPDADSIVLHIVKDEQCVSTGFYVSEWWQVWIPSKQCSGWIRPGRF